MQFQIGPDLGLALAKGVVLSLVTVFTFIPALTLVCLSLIHISGGKWVYPHGDAATRVRDAVNAELQSRGMQPDAKIFCCLLYTSRCV